MATTTISVSMGRITFSGTYVLCSTYSLFNVVKLRLASRVEHKESGRALECFSNQPGVQLYTGNFIPNDGSLKGKGGSTYGKHGGFCLETQTYPDAVNQAFDHDGIIRPGQVYQHDVLYKFFF